MPKYLVRDRDGAYGEAFIRRIQAMGIRDRLMPDVPPFDEAGLSGYPGKGWWGGSWRPGQRHRRSWQK